MTCTLNRFETYDLANVKHDISGGQWVIRLSRPPATCPDGLFITKKAVLHVDSNLTNALLGYNSASNRPVIMVSSESVVQNINIPESHFFSTLFWVLVVAAIGYGLFRLFKKVFSEPSTPMYVPTYRREALEATNPPGAPTQASYVPTSPAPVIVNNTSGGGNDGFLTGMMMGNLLSGGHSSHETHVDHYIETEHRHENAPATTSVPDDEEETAYSSDDSSSSYSSDSSSSSYSSDDSSSSYSSDSSSSDSGSSFSSD